MQCFFFSFVANAAALNAHNIMDAVNPHFINEGKLSHMIIYSSENEKFVSEQRNSNKVKLATIVEGDPKAPFSIATTPRCRGGRYSIPWIAPLYP